MDPRESEVFNWKRLPREILMKVFMKLPVDALMKSSAVCKSWYLRIFNPLFLKTHFKLACSVAYGGKEGGPVPHILLIPYLHWNDKKCVAISFCQNAFIAQQTYELPFGNLDAEFRLVGNSCGGIVCLRSTNFIEDIENGTDGSELGIYLYNPAARVFRRIEIPPDEIKNRAKNRFGFGYTKDDDDFKVVLIRSARSWIYSLRKKSWKKIEAQYPKKYKLFEESVTCHAIVYWRGYTGLMMKNVLVSFNMCKIEFGAIEFPFKDSCDFVSMANWGSNLAIHSVERKADLCHVIWVLPNGEASWEKKLTVNAPIGCLVGFTRNENLICRDEEGEGKLVSWDPQNQLLKGFPIDASPFCVDVTFVESLAMVEFKTL